MRRIANNCRAIFLGALAIALAGCRHAHQESPPDLLLVNGTVITVDASDRIAEAIAAIRISSPIRFEK